MIVARLTSVAASFFEQDLTAAREACLQAVPSDEEREAMKMAGSCRTGTAKANKPGLSFASSNDHVAALQNFGNWLIKGRPKRWPENPLMVSPN